VDGGLMSKIRLYGSTSGYIDLAAPAVADDATLTLPTGAVGFGKVLQVVTSSTTSTQSTTSTSFVDVTDMSVTITPTFNSSQILVIANIGLGNSGSGSETLAQLVRDSTPIGNGADGFGSCRNAGNMNTSSIIYLDSPATTSSIVYKVQFRIEGVATAYVNRNGTTTSTMSSTIAAIEIGA
jgi:hypothetical protein